MLVRTCLLRAAAAAKLPALDLKLSTVDKNGTVTAGDINAPEWKGLNASYPWSFEMKPGQRIEFMGTTLAKEGEVVPIVPNTPEGRAALSEVVKIYGPTVLPLYQSGVPFKAHHPRLMKYFGRFTWLQQMLLSLALSTVGMTACYLVVGSLGPTTLSHPRDTPEVRAAQAEKEERLQLQPLGHFLLAGPDIPIKKVSLSVLEEFADAANISVDTVVSTVPLAAVQVRED